jgi:redox-sensitive bicupin YhaK (pirin superfamily)
MSMASMERTGNTANPVALAPAPRDRHFVVLLHGRPRDLGGFQVRRVLPAPEHRRVGPFVFWDHMGPATFEPGHGVDVRPHPHIGLATVTYLFEGEIVHRDSLGSHQPIRPGAVNWMTAGRGIVHSERKPDSATSEVTRAHGIQAWIGLPLAHEEAEPTFHHHPRETLPEVTRGGARVRVLAGTAYGLASPVEVFSPTLYVDAELDEGAELELPGEHAERAVYVAVGAAMCDGERVDAGAMLVLAGGVPATLRALAPSRVMLLGGAPLDGERHVFWNFVSSSRERIEQAKRDWREGRFPKVPGDEVEFIPLPA